MNDGASDRVLGITVDNLEELQRLEDDSARDELFHRWLSEADERREVEDAAKTNADQN